MNVVNKKKYSFGIALLALTILTTACNMPRTLGGATPIPTIDLPPTVVSGFPFEPSGDLELLVNNWYVAPDGYDDFGNTCEHASAPCQTIGQAIFFALYLTDPEGHNFHVINLAAGTYTLDDSYYMALRGNVSIIGQGAGVTIVDRMGTEGGFSVDGDQSVTFENFTIRAARDCISIQDTSSAEVMLSNVDLIDCRGNGVENRGTGPVQLTNVNIRGAQGQGFGPANGLEHGHGIFNFGDLNVELGEIRDSEKFGIRNLGDLTITGATIAANTFEGLHHEAGTAMLTNVQVSDHNLAASPVAGITAHSTMQIFDSTIRANDEGINLAPGASLTMVNSTVRDHPRRALSVQSGSTADIQNSLIQNNATNDITTILNRGELTLSQTDMAGNFGSAIYAQDSSIVNIEFSNITATTFAPSTSSQTSLPTIYIEGTSSILNINNSLVANNILEGGMATIESGGQTNIFNSTISNNQGLGLNLWGTATISYSTIAENTQFGLLTSGINVDNTIIARNTPSDCINTLSLDGSTSTGVNIDTDGSCGVAATYSPSALLLGGLADNGGPTQTHALMPGSPAIDAALGSCPTVDQRNFGRPVGAGCDVGAYETGAVIGTTESEEEEEEPGDATTVTVLIPDTPCYTGPGPDWGFVNNFSAGTTMEIVGAGYTGNGNQAWVVSTHPTAENVNCWLPGDNVTTGIPLGEMRLISVPPKPTPLPTPTPNETREPTKEPTPCPLNGNGVPTC